MNLHANFYSVVSCFEEFPGRTGLVLGLADFFVAARFGAVDCRVVWVPLLEFRDLGLATRFFPASFEAAGSDI